MRNLLPACGAVAALAACASTPTTESIQTVPPDVHVVSQWDRASFLEPTYVVGAIPAPETSLKFGAWRHPSPLLRSSQHSAPAHPLHPDAGGAGEHPASATCDAAGTWQMIDYQYDGNPRPIDGARNLLFFNRTHWVQVAEIPEEVAEPTTLTVGGVYTVVGDTLYQTPTIGNPSGGRPSAAYWCRTEEDRLYLKSRAQGNLYEYTYERVAPEKPDNAP